MADKRLKELKESIKKFKLMVEYAKKEKGHRRAKKHSKT